MEDFIKIIVQDVLEQTIKSLKEYLTENKEDLLLDIFPQIIEIKKYIQVDLRNKILYENPSQDLKEVYEKLDRSLFMQENKK